VESLVAQRQRAGVLDLHRLKGVRVEAEDRGCVLKERLFDRNTQLLFARQCKELGDSIRERMDVNRL